jgi:hypothetical protein
MLCYVHSRVKTFRLLLYVKSFQPTLFLKVTRKCTGRPLHFSALEYQVTKVLYIYRVPEIHSTTLEACSIHNKKENVCVNVFLLRFVFDLWLTLF